ncbi:MAG: beta-lactamase family protein [Armatimonadetes bacterium]|nr:beta-lactamase family protein [Armatimonadota bacterium]MDE2206560.1 beta-lactamase family protein [Armatimonadota bacterium]
MKNLDAILEPICRQNDLPALAGAIVTSHGLIAEGAVGVRAYGGAAAVTINDQFHLGSDTKAMTATLIGILVDRGKLRWNETLAEALPQLATVMQPAYRRVTLDELMAHRAGFSAETSLVGKNLMQLHRLGGTGQDQLDTYVRLLLQEPPVNVPGTAYLYSNRSFAVAGCIAAYWAHIPYEQLMRQWLFKPLGMTTAGFGAMGTPGRVDEPLQHIIRNGKHIPVPPGPYADNPVCIAPAGLVHCSIGDWAKFIQLELRGAEGKNGIISSASVRHLQTPVEGGNYSGGWLTAFRPWGAGAVLTHAGSNTMNFAVVWIAPKKDFAVLAATNQGGDAAATACDQTSAALIGMTEGAH